MTDSEGRRSIGGLLREIRVRHVVPWTLAYLAGAWVLVEATSYLASIYDWPDTLLYLLPIILGVGTLSAVVVAWFHGAGGWQPIQRREALLHGGIGVVLLVSLGLAPDVPDPPVTDPGRTTADNPADNASAGPGEPSVTRVAVLYFKNHSATAEGGALADGLTEDVVHRLASLPALDVLPLTAVLPYRGEAVAPLEEIVDALRVGALLEGSVQQVDGSVRVAAQLIDGRSGGHLGSWMLDCRAGTPECDVPGVAGQISDSVRVRIGAELRRRRAEEGARVAAALAAYRRARTMVDDQAGLEWREDRRGGLALLENADRLLAEAERLDPSWPAPVVLRMEVAEVGSQLQGGAGSREPGRLRVALEHADRALALVRDSAPILERRGQLRIKLASYSGRLEAEELIADAEVDLRTAVTLDPTRAGAWWALSGLYNRKASFETAYRMAAKAYEADSFGELGAAGIFRLLHMALQLEQHEEAARWCAEGRRRYPVDQEILQGCLMGLASHPDPSPAAIEEAWRLTAVFGEPEVSMAETREAWVAWGEAITATVLAASGRADSADRVLRRALPRLRQASEMMYAQGIMFEALARHRLGQPDSALHLLTVYVDLVPAAAPQLAREWWFRGLWQDPRYQALHAAPMESSAGR